MQGPSPENADELRVFGLITFVAVFVGASIAVFDSNLWLVAEDTRTNSFTYAMGAFTLQGMSYVMYKMLMQDSMDTKATMARWQREQARTMQEMQMQLSKRQMDVEIMRQRAMLEQQMEALEGDPEVAQYMLLHRQADELMTRGGAGIPSHETTGQAPMPLGVDVTQQPRSSDGKFASKKK